MPDEYCHLQTVCDDSHLRVSFHWAVDRYAHTVWACRGKEAAAVLQSVEGQSDEQWPASPPIQQLNCQRRDGKPAALLGVGMAGRSHWSLSVDVARLLPALAFDVASRPRGEGGRLASRYRISATSASRVDDDTILVEHPLGQIQVQLQPSDGYSTASLSLIDQELVIEPPPVTAKTARWKYRVVAVAGG
jgi:hypothetical protein